METISLSAQKVLKALGEEPLSERDLFVRLRPMDRLALRRVLAELIRGGLVVAHDEGRLPGPVVTTYRLGAMAERGRS